MAQGDTSYVGTNNRVKNSFTYNNATTSFTEVVNTSITTKGGTVRIYFAPNSQFPSSVQSQIEVTNVPTNSEQSGIAEIKLLRDSVDVFGKRWTVPINNPTGVLQNINCLIDLPIFEDRPSAGTYTYSIEARIVTVIGSTTRIRIDAFNIVVEELDDAGQP